MSSTIMHKDPQSWRKPPNIPSYEDTYRAFRWEDAEALIDGLPEGRGINIAYEAIDRHLKGNAADRVALRWCGVDGRVEDLSYRDLAQLTNRFANALRQLGVGPQEAVFSLCGRVPALYVAAFGALKARCVFSPLFSAFGPEPIMTRMNLGEGRVLVTTAALYRRKIAPMREQLSHLKQVIIVDAAGDAPEGTLDFHTLIDQASPDYIIEPTSPDDQALLHFTSGTTGTPKGAVHVHRAVIAHHIAGRFALDLHPDDIYWCTADPGWVTGTSFGMISPLTNAVTMIIDEGEFDGQRWYQLLQDQKVNVWYTAPTAIRMLMKLGADLPRQHDLSALRFIASVGEPLNPEAVRWGQEAFAMPIHDNWWQTETGGIMIANYAAMAVKPGSMGRPLPGIEAALVRRGAEGALELVTGADEEGELALKVGWPSMFRGYLNQEAKYQSCFASGYYLSGDLAKRDQDGYYWFVGRADDVIKSAGHLIGPFEVESALMEHPAVAEAAVIGKPDPMLMEVVKAFVALKPGYEASPELQRELMALSRKKLGPAVAPREIDVLPSLPKTRSGKIMRRLLKARELGLPEGDTSTLEQMG